MGSFAVTFPENPFPLGLPSIHDKDRYWEPFFQACQDTETTICMHIGSSSKMPSTSPDAPFIVSSTLTFSNAMGSMCDYIFSGTLERFPTLKIAYSEGQVGWMPYVMERADKLAAERSDNSFGTQPAAAAVELRQRGSTAASSTTRSASPTATSSAWTRSASRPTTRTPTRPSRTPKKVVEDICTQAGLNEEERYKLLRGQRDHRVRPGALRHHPLAE